MLFKNVNLKMLSLIIKHKIMITRDEILKEIKRTAKENNDKPLGQTAFKNKTGIGWYEWGRHWPKWGNAIQEAGFTPNEPWARVSDDYLVKKMINKIRKFKRYPTLAELRIESIKDFNFPYSIIKKRKQEFITKKIVEYCKNKKSCKDILKACQPIVKKIDEKEKNNDSGTVNEFSEVYLLKSGLNYKIGHADDPGRRSTEIGTLLADKPKLIHSFKTDDPIGVESYWHKRFEKKRGRGEWFKLKQQDIEAFKRWKRIY